MILEIIATLSGVAAVGSIANIFMKNREFPREKNGISIKKYMPGNLPIITLTNNNVAVNFLIDTGSNISHICKSVVKELNTKSMEASDVNVAGLGAINKTVNFCKATFKDVLSRKYIVELSISEELDNTADYIEQNTGIRIHGLLGTDFLQNYKYTIDFNTLEIYTEN